MLDSGLPLSQPPCRPYESGPSSCYHGDPAGPCRSLDEKIWEPDAPCPPTRLTEGWLIERIDLHGAEEADHESIRRFLQIGTGQWCGAPYATLFPMRRTALAYTREFGLFVDRNVRIVAYSAP